MKQINHISMSIFTYMVGIHNTRPINYYLMTYVSSIQPRDNWFSCPDGKLIHTTFDDIWKDDLMTISPCMIEIPWQFNRDNRTSWNSIEILLEIIGHFSFSSISNTSGFTSKLLRHIYQLYLSALHHINKDSAGFSTTKNYKVVL